MIQGWFIGEKMNSTVSLNSWQGQDARGLLHGEHWDVACVLLREQGWGEGLNWLTDRNRTMSIYTDNPIYPLDEDVLVKTQVFAVVPFLISAEDVRGKLTAKGMAFRFDDGVPSESVREAISEILYASRKGKFFVDLDEINTIEYGEGDDFIAVSVCVPLNRSDIESRLGSPGRNRSAANMPLMFW